MMTNKMMSFSSSKQGYMENEPVHQDSDLEKLDLDFVSKLVQKLEKELEDSDYVPASYLELDPTEIVSSHASDDEPATDGYEDYDEPTISVQCAVRPEMEAVLPAELWCSCDRCDILPTRTECYCCNESEQLESLRHDQNCVTETTQFENLIADKELLKYSRYSYTIIKN